MTDWQELAGILEDVWNTATIAGDNELQRQLTITAKTKEILDLLDSRGLYYSDSRGKLAVADWALDLFLAGIETGKKYR